MNNERIFYFEWARAFGALAVVLLHLFSCQMDNMDVEAIGAVRAIVYSDIQILFSRWAVPIFIMITGALLLNPSKKLTYRKIGSYIIRMLCVLLTFGFTYCLIESYIHEQVINPHMFFSSLLNLFEGDSWSHMWYIYALIGLYILTPVLKPYVASSNKRQLCIGLTVLFIITSLIPTVNLALQINLTSFIVLPVSVFYYLFGYYASRYIELNKAYFVVGICAGLAIVILVSLSLWFEHSYLSWVFSTSSSFIVIFSGFVFIVFKRFADLPYQNHRVIKLLANYSFGIYLVHPIFLNIFFKLDIIGENLYIYPGITEILIYLFTLFGSLMLVYILKHLPGIRKLI